MRTRRTRTLVAALLCAGAAASCDNPAAPKQVPEAELVFVRAATDAPPLDSMQVHVWAKAGEERRVAIRYVKVGGYGGDECMEFKVPGNGLWKRPDGTVVAHGDSVLITITVVDPRLFNFRFEPSGLQFRADHPAELRVSYKWADPDFNGDGLADDRDTKFRFGVWKQETDGAPWTETGTVKDTDFKELRADIRGFTKYALAGG
jgi:hypothetical protein